MSHFAEIKDGIVQRVIVADQDFINSGKVGDSSSWVETSYDDNFRKQYCGPGYTYDSINDVFVCPQPFPSWTIDSSHDWQPPIPEPSDGSFVWNESNQSWDERG
jgi:hypothetical protein